MFKLVVLFSALALARGSGIIAAPLTYTSAVIAPATTTISKQFSSVVHPSPLTYHYASPIAYSHYLKKRSAPFVGTYSTYGSPLYSAPLLHSTSLLHSTHLLHSAPLLRSTSVLHSGPILHPAPAYSHYIKKRSVAPFAYSSYIPTAYSTSSRIDYSTPLVHSAPFIHSSPLYHPAHFGHYLHKRSVVPLAYASILPASYSHQSRIDFHSSPLISHASYAAPLTYTAHLPYSHIY